MNSRFKYLVLIAFVSSFSASANATIILANGSDAQAIDTSGSGTALSVAADTATTLRVGRFDDPTAAPNGSNSSAVFSFLLPNLGAIANPFTAATFNFDLANTTNNFNNTELQGLGTRASSAVLAEDFDFGTLSGTTAETTLQGGILNTASTVGLQTSNDISAYLNTQYAGGANAGEFVFLRINVAAANSNIFNNAQNGFTITSADAGSDQPFIHFTAIPEPSTFAILFGGIGMLLLRRSRRRCA